jgi:hypothetical protein
MTQAFLNEYILEINEFPVKGPLNNLFSIKDYFFYNSNVKEYGHRSLLIPVSKLINNDKLPSEEVIRELIAKKAHVIKRVVDARTQSETWSFKYE